MNCKEWKELRKRKLIEFPYCELHEEWGIKLRATCVHHKKEVESATTYEEMRELCYDYGNLQALCNECHHRIHQANGYNTREAHRKRMEALNNHGVDSIPVWVQTGTKKDGTPALRETDMTFINEMNRASQMDSKDRTPEQEVA